MDTKKTLKLLFLFISFLLSGAVDNYAQTPTNLQFCDRTYNYGIGNDSIKVYFNITGTDGKRISDLSADMFDQMAYFYEDGHLIEKPEIKRLSSGVRIPKENIFSILLDRSIPKEGKEQILESIKQFIDIAPDSCVFISFYGDEVSNTVKATKQNFDEIRKTFLLPATGKSFYSGIHSKLAEFSKTTPDFINSIKATDYVPNPLISSKATANPGKNFLMVFAEGSQRPDDEVLDFLSMTDYQAQNAASLPKVYAFYYTADGEDPKIVITLEGLTHPQDSTRTVIERLKGEVTSSANMNDVLSRFQTVIESATYDYELKYSATPEKIYTGNIAYEANWGKTNIGDATFTIGSAERPWPEKEQSTTNLFVELLVAILIAFLTFAFFFFVMKVVVPFIESLSFKSKYYKKYQPEENVQRRICHYCKQDLKPGQVIVTKCNHWMHKHCWEENGYKCAEFGQNCKTGIQNHIDWKELFRLNSLKECSQTIVGILAGLVSWILYELCGRGGFKGISEFIVGLVINENDAQVSLIGDCVARTSSFLMIGLLLGFFISLVFRYKDDIRNKNWKVRLKIIGLSVMTGIIGMLAFAIGADLFCLILTWTGKTYIPWYCSLPAYVLFSISVSLALTIKSSIPVKSALLGGCLSALIGFLVLYFTKFTSSKYEWLNMLLDFIIYGGGLGASLVTVRMLAEKYFLVIQNGVKAGQRIPIHKWMNATGGGNKVSIGMTGECEIQMNWEKSNKVAKEHAQLYIDHEKGLPVIKPFATGVIYNSRAELPVNRPAVLCNGDTFNIGDTIFKYEEA
ncbi:MAG: hypothetical protein HDS13_06850 [Bacteroides sp.]|nr:hypothetical protein [Bacteroides sp.]